MPDSVLPSKLRKRDTGWLSLPKKTKRNPIRIMPKEELPRSLRPVMISISMWRILWRLGMDYVIRKLFAKFYGTAPPAFRILRKWEFLFPIWMMVGYLSGKRVVTVSVGFCMLRMSLEKQLRMPCSPILPNRESLCSSTILPSIWSLPKKPVNSVSKWRGMMTEFLVFISSMPTGTG